MGGQKAWRWQRLRRCVHGFSLFCREGVQFASRRRRRRRRRAALLNPLSFNRPLPNNNNNNTQHPKLNETKQPPPPHKLTGCNAAAPPSGRPFALCAGCRRAAFCSRDCQRAAWPQHRVLCAPERLRIDRPAERAAWQEIKAGCTSAALPLLHDKLSLAHASWHKRLGRGVIVAWMEDWVNLAVRSRDRKCQVYLFYVPVSDFKGARADQAAVIFPVNHMSPTMRASLESQDPREALFVLFCDATGWGRTVGVRLAPSMEACERVLAEPGSGEALRRFDVLAVDLNKDETTTGWAGAMITWIPHP